VSGKASHTFAERVDRMKLPDELRQVIEPLLEQIDLLSGEIERRNEDLEAMAQEIPAVNHLRQIPGVGPLTALFFVLSIDDPHRFRRSRDVAAFFGLRPSMRESGGTSRYGPITKEGDPEMRRLLVQAAHAMMLTRKDCALKQWAAEVEGRRGKGKRAVAVARKLAVLMHHLWVTGENFEAFPKSKAA
jgi:transposase